MDLCTYQRTEEIEREGRRGREREDPDPIMRYPETCPEQRPVDHMQASQWIMHKDSIVPLWSIGFGFGVWLREGQITPALLLLVAYPRPFTETI